MPCRYCKVLSNGLLRRYRDAVATTVSNSVGLFIVGHSVLFPFPAIRGRQDQVSIRSSKSFILLPKRSTLPIKHVRFSYASFLHVGPTTSTATNNWPKGPGTTPIAIVYGSIICLDGSDGGQSANQRNTASICIWKVTLSLQRCSTLVELCSLHTTHDSRWRWAHARGPLSFTRRQGRHVGKFMISRVKATTRQAYSIAGYVHDDTDIQLNMKWYIDTPGGTEQDHRRIGKRCCVWCLSSKTDCLFTSPTLHTQVFIVSAESLSVLPPIAIIPSSSSSIMQKRRSLLALFPHASVERS
ncbi:hypothetical protein QR685DRAFT_60562 [Neurospora intermedia]|uniref:Uncharacterized protein n=1 Tax=Neurospora intermedia TaxID=5142 RepID=A0ABR3DT05_NEUIN